MHFYQNPFMIQFICSFTTASSLYIVMEYAPGGDLAALLKVMGRLTEREARRYVRCLSWGVLTFSLRMLALLLS